jgi:hypothetical protein
MLYETYNCLPGYHNYDGDNSAILITTVSKSAMARLLSQVRVSNISDDLLNACIRLLTPLVAK